MDPDRMERLQAIVSAAAGIPPAGRDAYLREQCAGDAELRAAVEQAIAEQQETITENNAVIYSRPLRPNDVLADRFRIIRLLGRGGMGEVYEAADAELGGSVAVKTLRPELVANAHFVTRFRREIQIARQVTHPNICRVFDVGYDKSDGGQRVFLTMEFLDGETLSQRLKRLGRFTLDAAMPYVEQIASGLSALHEREVIHRDLKPGNIMLASGMTGRQRAVVTDFGLSREVEDSGLSAASNHGSWAGTPDYMSPEQLRGRRLTPASDVYALGLILYEMLGGRKPFAGGHAVENAVQRATEEIQPLSALAPGIDPGWEALIMRCLSREPGPRPTAGEIASAARGDRSTAFTTTAPTSKRKLWPAIVAISAAATFSVWLVNRKPAPSPEPVITRLTSDGGLSFDPALSRDGKLLAFSSDRSGEGHLDIWVQQIGAVSPVRLSKWDTEETAPDFSPDGTRVAFRSEREGGGIYLVNTLGGAPRLIAAGGHNPKHSPDGKWLAYWRGIDSGTYPDGSAQVMVIPSEGGEPRAVAPDFAAALYPIWSPNSEELMVVAKRQASDRAVSVDWWILPLRGGKARQVFVREALRAAKLATPASQVNVIPLTWTSGPQRVVFAAGSGDATNLHEIEIGGDGKAAGPPRLLHGGTGFDAQISMDASGRRAAYSSLALNLDVWGAPLDVESGRATGPLKRVTTEVSAESFPSLSWDGRLLAYRSRSAGRNDLRIRNIVTGESRILVSSPEILGWPRISGDGSMVVYWHRPDTISRIATAGGEPKTLCTKCGVPLNAGASPDRFLLEPDQPPDDVFEIDANSGKIRSLIAQRGVLLGARWSRDGKWIAFHERPREGGNSRVFIAGIPGPATPDKWIAITDGLSADEDPAWSPGGNVLYFLSRRDGYRCVWAQRLNAATKVPIGKPQPVQHLHQSGLSMKHLGNNQDSIGFSVGGDMAVFALGDFTGNIWLREK